MRTLTFATLVYLLCGQISFAFEAPTIDSILQDYERSIDALSLSRATFVENVYDLGRSPEQEKLTMTTEYMVYRDGPRWKVKTERTTIRDIDNTEHHIKSASEVVVDKSLLRILRIAGEYDEDVPKFRVSTSRDSNVTAQRIREFFGVGSVLFGVLYFDDLPVWELLRDSETLELRPALELVKGAETYVLHSTCPRGTYTLWLDPKMGFLPRQIEARLAGRTPVADSRLGNAGILDAARKHEKIPMRIPRQVFRRFYNVEIEERAGHFVITSYDYTATQIHDDGEHMPVRREYRLSSIDFDRTAWPEGVFTPSISIPEGTRVRNEDEPTLAHAWINGKVEKIVDEGNWSSFYFAPGRRVTRIWILLALNAVAAVFVSVWLVNRAKRRSRQ